MIEASKDLVCVRVLSMAGLDLHTYRFDWDTTFAVLFMAPDGFIYHRYGNRDETDALSHLSMESLAATMRRTVADHAQRDPVAQPAPKAQAPFTVENIPPMARRIEKGEQKGCIHCHTVYDMLSEDAKEKGKWKRTDVWAWPPSSRVGLRLDRDDQSLVKAVEPGSPVAAAGLAVGDRLVTVGGLPVATEGDVQFVLENTSADGGSVRIDYMRKGVPRLQSATLLLGRGWREGGPLDLAYRNSVWKIGPRPGFGGKALTAEEKRGLGLPEDRFALRVGYLVTWGSEAGSGKNAQQAGVRKGDVLTSFDGKHDFESERHWHAWFRLTREPGKKVEIRGLRGKEPLEIALPVRKD